MDRKGFYVLCEHMYIHNNQNFNYFSSFFKIIIHKFSSTLSLFLTTYKALRCRFTELFVHELTDPTDLRLIASRYLTSLVLESPTMVQQQATVSEEADIAGLAYWAPEGQNPTTLVGRQSSSSSNNAIPLLLGASVDAFLKLRELAENDGLVDGANQRPRFSLRTFCRALSAAKHLYSNSGDGRNSSNFSARRSLFEGFSLAFESSLDIISKMKSKVILRKSFADMNIINKMNSGSGSKKKKSKSTNSNNNDSDSWYDNVVSHLESDMPTTKPGGRGNSQPYALVDPFWLPAGPYPIDDAAVNDSKTNLKRFVLTPHVSLTLRAVASAVAAGDGSPILLQV